jgi:hypothetical protein
MLQSVDDDDDYDNTNYYYYDYYYYYLYHRVLPGDSAFEPSFKIAVVPVLYSYAMFPIQLICYCRESIY